jgi:hypothetical protein
MAPTTTQRMKLSLLSMGESMPRRATHDFEGPHVMAI